MVESLLKSDINYWNEFYKVNPPDSMKESLFAKFVSNYVETGKNLVDIGCGNGRDSIFFNKIGLNVLGIDSSNFVIETLKKFSSKSLSFINGNFINEKSVYEKIFDYYYSRFTLHAIEETGENEFINNVYRSLNTNGKFFIEVRSVHDEKFGKGKKVARNAYIFDGHYRRFIVMEELLLKLIKTGFSIKYAEEETGFAPFGKEDSPIIRIIALKSNPAISIEMV